MRAAIGRMTQAVQHPRMIGSGVLAEHENGVALTITVLTRVVLAEKVVMTSDGRGTEEVSLRGNSPVPGREPGTDDDIIRPVPARSWQRC